MSEEEKQAFEELIRFINPYITDMKSISMADLRTIYELIKKQNSIIDLMAEELAKKYLSHLRKCSLNKKEIFRIKCDKFENCTDCVKEYFREKVYEDV